MIDEIQKFEQQSKVLEFSKSERETIFQKVIEHLHGRLNNNDSEKPYLLFESKETTAPTYTETNNLEEVLQEVETEIYQKGLNAASPYHMAYIPGGGQLYGGVGDFIAAICNKYASVHYAGPGAVKMENDLVSWMANIMGYDSENAGGCLVSGGSIANLTAIVAARDARLEIEDFRNAVVYTTTQTHHCVQKALRIAGLIANHPSEKGNIRYIEIDEQFRMIPNKLEEAIQEDLEDGRKPFMVVASAGTTNFGSVDPLSSIGNLCEKYNIWFHVDAAYGGFFQLTSYGKEKLKGIEKSDSLVLDPHKGLFMPYGLGTVIVKNRKHLLNSFYYSPDYIDDPYAQISSCNLSPELTKHFRGMRLWLPLKILSVHPFKAALEEKLLLANYWYKQLQSIPEIECVNEPELSVFAWRFVPQSLENKIEKINQINQELNKRIVANGPAFLSGTWYKANGKSHYVIRCVVLVFRTHLHHVNKAIEGIKKEIKTLDISSIVN